MQTTRARAALSTILLAAIALRLFLAWAIPLDSGSRDPNCAPDELWHYWVARNLALGRTSSWPDEPFSIYSAFLPTHYLLHVAGLLPERMGFDPPWLYRFPPVHPAVRGYPLARLGSVALGFLTVAAASFTVLKLSASVSATLFGALVVALLPQLAFVNSYVNADALTIAGSACLTAALATWYVAGEATTGLRAVGVALGLVVLGKVSGYYILLPSVVWVVWALRGRPEGKRGLATMILVAAAVCLPFLAWNGFRNGGDFLGLARYARFLDTTWKSHYPSEHVAYLFLVGLARSSFGAFRNMDLVLPDWLYLWALGTIAIGLVLALRWCLRDPERSRPLLWLSSTVALNVALVAYNCWTVDFQPQGRYVLGSVINLILVAAVVPQMSLRRNAARVWVANFGLLMIVASTWSAFTIYRSPCLPSGPIAPH